MAEAEKRLLDLNRQIIATTARHSHVYNSAGGQDSQEAASEAFSWDQVCLSPSLNVQSTFRDNYDISIAFIEMASKENATCLKHYLVSFACANDADICFFTIQGKSF